MFKMIRIFSLILCISLIFGVCSSVSAKEPAQLSEEEIGILYTTGVILNKKLSEEELSAAVTRAEFIGYAARALNVSDATVIGDEYYIDITESKQKNLINYFAKAGYISVGDERIFEPERNISLEEAVKITVEMLGFGDVARARGGFPLGYIYVARQADVWDEGYTKETTLRQTLRLLANTLGAFVSNPSGFSENEVTYSEGDGETMLSLYHGIKKTEGLMRTAGNVSVDNSQNREKEVLVGEVYIGAKDDLLYTAEGLIGQWVSAYYKEEIKDVKELVYVCNNDSNCIEIPLTDIKGLDKNYTLSCYINDKDKEYKVSRSASILYNGELETQNQRELFNSLDEEDNGFVKLIDINRDSVYDYVIMKQYEDYVADFVYTEQMRFYGAEEADSLELEEYETVRFYNTENDSISMNDLGGSGIISYAAGKGGKFFEAIVSTEVLYGEIETTKTRNGLRVFSIGGKEYAVLNRALDGINIGAGDIGSFRLNGFGQIVHIEFESDSTYSYAFLLEKKTESGIDDRLYIKYFSSKGEMKISEVSEKVLVDGKRYKTTAEILAAIPNSTKAMLYPQVARIHLNEDGVITAIDTTNCSDAESEDVTLVDTAIIPTNIYGAYVSWVDGTYQLVGNNIIIDKSTIIFCAPPLQDVIDGNYSDSDFFLAPQVRYNSNSIIYGVTLNHENTLAYKTGVKTMTEGALICFDREYDRPWYAGYNCLMVVSETGGKTDKDGIPKTYIGGYANKRPAELLIADDYMAAFTALGIEEGDTLAYGYNKYGEINDIKVIYDASQGGKPFYQSGTNWETENQLNVNNGLMTCNFYYAAAKNSDFVRGFFDEENYSVRASDGLFTVGDVTIVDLNADDGNMVKLGTIEDIRCADTVGAEHSSMIIRRKLLDGYEVIVYNR